MKIRYLVGCLCLIFAFGCSSGSSGPLSNTVATIPPASNNVSQPQLVSNAIETTPETADSEEENAIPSKVEPVRDDLPKVALTTPPADVPQVVPKPQVNVPQVAPPPPVEPDPNIELRAFGEWLDSKTTLALTTHEQLIYRTWAQRNFGPFPRSQVYTYGISDNPEVDVEWEVIPDRTRQEFSVSTFSSDTYPFIGATYTGGVYGRLRHGRVYGERQEGTVTFAIEDHLTQVRRTVPIPSGLSGGDAGFCKDCTHGLTPRMPISVTFDGIEALNGLDANRYRATISRMNIDHGWGVSTELVVEEGRKGANFALFGRFYGADAGTLAGTVYSFEGADTENLHGFEGIFETTRE